MKEMETVRQPKRLRISSDLVNSSDVDRNATVVLENTIDGLDDNLPSARDISTVLRDVESRSPRGKSLRALHQLQQWLMDEKRGSSVVVLENFEYYGGVARVLDFMEDNIDDWDCVVGVAATLADFLCFRWNAVEANRKAATKFAKIIVQRNGIQILLRAYRKHAPMHKVSSTMKHIWIALGRTINGNETRAMITKKQKLSVLICAINCIHHLEESGNGQDSSVAWASDVLEVVLYVIANVIQDISIGKEEFSRTDLVESCLKIISINGKWIRNDAVVTYILGILTICTKQKKTTLTKKQFESLLPPLIFCTRRYYDKIQTRNFLLALLESACEKVKKKKMESTGVLEAFSALVRSDRIDEEAKEKARCIMRMIIN